MVYNVTDRYKVLEAMTEMPYYENASNDELYHDMKIVIEYQNKIELIVYLNSFFNLQNEVIKRRIRFILLFIVDDLVNSHATKDIDEEILLNKLDQEMYVMIENMFNIKINENTRK